MSGGRNRSQFILCAGLAFFAVAVSSWRIASTWRLFTETKDEAFHIACGMEWLSAGSYTYETQHPPLARIVLALGPFLHGSVFHHRPAASEEGRAILDGRRDYFAVLAEARAGNLLFYWLACLAVWLLAATYCEAPVAAAAVGAFTLIPTVLGHAGLATTDLGLTAFVALAFWSWQSWLHHPGAWPSVRTGALTALAVLCKFSSVLFLPLMLAAALATWRKRRSRIRFVHMAEAAGTALFLALAVYRSDVTPIRTPPGRRFLLIEHYLGTSGFWVNAVYRVTEIPLPLAGLWKGLGEVYQHNAQGHEAYLLGSYSQHGWWYFFPVVLAVKTPLALLLLACAGGWMLRRCQAARSLLFAAGAILVAGMVSRIDIGIRHILPIFCFLAVLAGMGSVELWKRSRILTCLVWIWLIAGSVRAHPEYFADFNSLAGSEPERIVDDSDLDWGQDLNMTTHWFLSHGVKDPYLAYSGVFPPEREKRVTYKVLAPLQPVNGWLAVSVRMLHFEAARARAAGQPEPYGWLRSWRPVARAGSSMLIYHMDPVSPPVRVP